MPAVVAAASGVLDVTAAASATGSTCSDSVDSELARQLVDFDDRERTAAVRPKSA